MFKKHHSILILGMPMLLKYAFQLLFMDWALFDVEDIIEDVFFFLVILFLLYSSLIKKQVFKDLVCFVYILYVVLETTSYLAISSNFSSSFMYLLLESNPQEFSEFTSSYVSVPIVLFIVLNIILFFVIRRHSFRTYNKYHKWIGVLGVLLITAGLKLTGAIESNAYHNTVRGIYGYIDLQNSMRFSGTIKKEDVIVSSDNEVLVFVLGESTARGHMQLYGYQRETTPLLSSIKDSLYVYNEVISTDVLTLKSAPKIISSLDIDTRDEELIHIVELFNIAGFDTYWLSNQRAISYHDNAISKIASASDWFKFYNHLIDKHTLVTDNVLLPDYTEILKKPGKKLIVLRLIGTHFDYSKRYPETFNVFAKETEGLSEAELLNRYYDNAVLYNDFIVFSLINKLKQEQQKSALFYISDHGENIYDEGTDFFGRSEEILTKSMFEIPFILWTSNAFELPSDFEYVPNRKFMADHTFESVCHVFGVSHKSSDLKRSIFSNSFVERKRTVLDKVHFDTYFENKP